MHEAERAHVREQCGIPKELEGRVRTMRDGEELALGRVWLRVLHSPGWPRRIAAGWHAGCPLSGGS